MKISAIITAAGKNSRMKKDQVEYNLPIKNKLTLSFKDSTVIQTTIDNVLNSNVDECIVVLGHYSSEIKEAIFNNYEGQLKFIKNNPIDVSLSTSLYNGLKVSKYSQVLCVAADQPTVLTKTYNRLIENNLNSINPEKTISVLRRIKSGKLDSAKGLGMPFVANRNNLMKYLKKEDDNLNPILRKMFKEGFEFFGIKEINKEELININHIKDYNSLNLL